MASLAQSVLQRFMGMEARQVLQGLGTNEQKTNKRF
jgi:hypothetical protein